MILIFCFLVFKTFMLNIGFNIMDQVNDKIKMFGRKFEMNKHSLHYELIGNGNEYLLLLPGGIGKLF